MTAFGTWLPPTLQQRLDALAYPPTHTYTLPADRDGEPVPTGILAERWALLQRHAPSFWEGRGTFLDVGANKGFFSLLMRARGFRVTSIEPPAPDETGYIYKTARLLSDLGCEVDCTTFREWAPPQFQYDRIYVGNAHHYLYREAGWAFLRKLAALCAPGGQVLIEGPLGNECADVRACLPPEILGDFRRERFFAEAQPLFDVGTPVPTVAYTPDRYIVLLRHPRETESAYTAEGVSRMVESGRMHRIWSNEANRSAVCVPTGGAQIAKLYEDPPRTIERSLAFHCVSPWSNGVTAIVRDAAMRAGHSEAAAGVGRLLGWWEQRLPIDHRFDKGWRDRPEWPGRREAEATIFREWCRHNAFLARLGMVDVDPGPANWHRRGDGWVTFDKNAVWPIATLPDAETNPADGRLIRTFHWTSNLDAVPLESRVAICQALASRNSVVVEEAFTRLAEAE